MQRWRKLGRVFVGAGQQPWMASHASMPIAAPLDERTVRVYFSPRDREGRSSLGWLDLDLRRPSAPLRVCEEPLLTPGPAGRFDDRGAMASWLVEDGAHELLYYQGWNTGGTVPFHTAIGLAARPLGETGAEFGRCFDGPIVARSRADPLFVSTPCVMNIGGSWRMWYASGIDWQADGALARPRYDFRVATSADGVDWRPTGGAVVSFAHPGEVAMARPCVLARTDGFEMWYSYRGDDWGYLIGYATSPDGLSWTRRDSEAGIAVDAGSWEGPMICYPFVFDLGDARYMLYNGGRYGAGGFGLAVLEAA